MSKNLFIIFIVILFLGCGPKYVSIKPTGIIQTNFSLNKNYDTVWEATVNKLIEQKYQIDNIDKKAGIITTKTKLLSAKTSSEFTYSEFDAIYQILDEFKQENTIKIFKLSETKTSINILSTFTGKNIDSENGNSSHVLKTNGVFEKMLFNAINTK